MEKRYEKGCKILVNICGACKPDEKILIITDNTSMEIGMAMWEATAGFPNRSMIVMEDRSAHSEEPAPLVVAAMMEADVLFNATKYSINNTWARREACRRGARSVNMADYTLEMLEQSGIFTDYEEAAKMVDQIASNFEGKVAHITTPGGTDYVTNIEGAQALRQYGRSLVPGQSSSPPDIECCVFATPGYGDGVIVADASMTHPDLGVVEQDPVKLIVKNGTVQEILGGANAEKLKKILSEFTDQRVYNVGEIGIGLNKACHLIGRMLEDEGCYRTAHLALGSNNRIEQGDCPFHLDMMMKDPTIEIDGKMILDHGEVVW